MISSYSVPFGNNSRLFRPPCTTDEHAAGGEAPVRLGSIAIFRLSPLLTHRSLFIITAIDAQPLSEALERP